VIRVASRASNVLRRGGDRFPDGETYEIRSSVLADRSGDRDLARISFAIPTTLCERERERER